MRKLMGIVGLRPKQIAHKRALHAKALAEHNGADQKAEPAKA
jgi:hypothetical protein